MLPEASGSTLSSGGYGDFTDNTLGNIHIVQSLYPTLFTQGVATNSFDSGSDTIHGNGSRDIIFGSGGAVDELHGYNSSAIIVGDFSVIHLDSMVDYLYEIFSVDSHNCTEDGGQNVINGDDDYGIIVGKQHQVLTDIACCFYYQGGGQNILTSNITIHL